MSYIQTIVPEIKKIEQELNEGLDRTPRERELCRMWLLYHMIANDLSLVQLRERIWEDSDWVFSQIFD